MKFDVPLMMPAIHSMRFAVSPSRSALMIGMPPATAASNATITPFAEAAAKISLPCCASSALFAVTTCLPFAIAASTSVRAGSEAADQLADDVDVRMLDDDRCIVGQVDVGGAARAAARAIERARRDPADADRPSGAAGDLLLVAAEYVPHALADGAEADDARPTFSGRHARRGRVRQPCSNPSSRNICLMPRIAWRVRASFSIIAKRT